jgi:molybdenum cofactor biosynthesis enzyme MoaA
MNLGFKNKSNRLKIDLREIRINLECNQNCPFCNTDKNAENVILDIPKTKKTIRIWAKQGTKFLTISGKEPTLHPKLIDFIKLAKKCRYKRIALQTNAILFKNKKFGQEIKKAGLDDAFVSFHSCKRNNYNRITQSLGFEDAVSGIKNILKLGIETRINIVINSLNYKELPQIIDFIAKNFKGIQAIVFSFVAPVSGAKENKWIIPQISSVVPFLRKAIKKVLKYKLRFEIPSRCGFPMCFLPEYYNYFDDITTIYFWDTDKFSDKVKPIWCRECRLRQYCSGFWKDYVKIYGFK